MNKGHKRVYGGHRQLALRRGHGRDGGMARLKSNAAGFSPPVAAWLCAKSIGMWRSETRPQRLTLYQQGTPGQ